jgi:GAF domain-containing protein
VIADLRGGLVSATLSLNLMTIVADSVDRAMLFLVQRDMMIALGAFGNRADGTPLVEATQGMCVPIGTEGVLADCVADGRARTVEYDALSFTPDLRLVIDRPHAGQAVLFPVLGSRRVIAVIYADNGRHARAIDDVEIVEIATAQVGLAFENELLRRQLDRGAYAP